MQLKQNCKRLVIAGFLVIWFIKLIVRPYFSLDEPLKFIFGVAPNFLDAFLIPFGAYWLFTHPNFFAGRLYRYLLFSDLKLICFTGFILMIIIEWVQLIPFFGRTFDYYDILFSGLGSLMGFYSFSSLQKKYSIAIKSYDLK